MSDEQDSKLSDLAKRLAGMPGDVGLHLLYRPHKELNGLSIKEWLDAGHPCDAVEKIVAEAESIITECTPASIEVKKLQKALEVAQSNLEHLKAHSTPVEYFFQCAKERLEARILARDWREKWSVATKQTRPPEESYPFPWEHGPYET